MMYRQGYRGGVWVDLEQPTNEEIRQIADEFSVSERVEAELLSPTPFPLVSSDQSMALVVLHFPVHRTSDDGVDGDTRSQEVDIIVGKRFVVTVRYEVVAPLHRLRKLLESEELVSGSASIPTDVLVEILFAHLYAAVRDLNERAQVAGLVHTHRAIAAERRETNNALLNAKQNEIIKILTVVSFIFLPLA